MILLLLSIVISDASESVLKLPSITPPAATLKVMPVCGATSVSASAVELVSCVPFKVSSK